MYNHKIRYQWGVYIVKDTSMPIFLSIDLVILLEAYWLYHHFLIVYRMVALWPQLHLRLSDDVVQDGEIWLIFNLWVVDDPRALDKLFLYFIAVWPLLRIQPYCIF